ncbi:MAG TPA: helix-turn-helix domain-containing protein [Saprospiraceae bacterium]|nr:helix-turn-helix domain-containing protein [Saprospiraceae bacterium]HMQ84109.1 helix-turn-helix domain-containing protein [Saprospiraceae bacterium]
MDVSNQQDPLIFLPDNIRYLRKRHGMSQEGLASKVGLNRGNIASYENGTAEPRICNLLKMARLFRVSIGDLAHKNLCNHNNLAEADQHFQSNGSVEKEVLQQFSQKAEELEGVIQSIHTCFQYKQKSMEEDAPYAKDMKAISAKFEELFEATEELLRQHQAFIEFVNCKC